MSGPSIVLAFGPVVNVAATARGKEEHRLNRVRKLVQEDGRIEDELIVCLKRETDRKSAAQRRFPL